MYLLNNVNDIAAFYEKQTNYSQTDLFLTKCFISVNSYKRKCPAGRAGQKKNPDK